MPRKNTIITSSIYKVHTTLCKHRTFLTAMVILFFNVIFFANSIFHHPQHYAIAIILGTILIGGLAIIHYQKGYSKHSWHKFNLALVIIIGISFFINGVYFSKKAYLALGASFVFVVPVLYYCLGQSRDIKSIYRSIAKGFVYSFILFLVYTVLSNSAILTGQYESFLGNANSLGVFMVAVLNALLYLLQSEDSKKRSTQALWIALTAMAVSFVLFSGSRTSFLAVMVSLIAFFVINFISNNKKRFFKTLGGMVSAIVISFLLVPMILAPLTLDFLGMPLVEFKSLATTDTVNGTEALEDGQIGERLQALSQRIKKTQGENIALIERIDRITSRRLGIWLEFVPEINLLGHADEYQEIKLREKHYSRTNAHNVYIQFAYSAGILAGVAMLIFSLRILYQSAKEFIKMYLNRKLDGEAFYRFLTVITFMISSLFSSTYSMYHYPHALSFWILIFPFFLKSNASKKVPLEVHEL